MAKVDTDKFIALMVEAYYRIQDIDRKNTRTFIDDVLEQMGFKVENGEIVELKPKTVMKTNESVDFFSVHGREEVAEIDKRIDRKQKEYDAKLRDRMMKAKDFPMTD